MRNTWKYKKIISPKYGDLGMFVLPIAWISIIFSVFIINYMIIKSILNIREELIFLNSINFDFTSAYTMSSHFIEKFVFGVLTNNIIIFFLFFVVILGIYIRFATKRVGKIKGIPFTIALYFLFFAMLFGFWWTVSIIYVAFNRKVSWR
jgi:hypothetical protein